MVALPRLGYGLLHCALMGSRAQATYDSRLEDRRSEATATIASSSICDARTINHITHTLPQLCLTKAWTSAAPSYNETSASMPPKPIEHPHERTSDSPDPNATTPTPSTNASTKSHTSRSTVLAHTSVDVPPDVEAATAINSEVEEEGVSFMSFEDWKEMILRQNGQDPQDLRSRRATGNQEDRRIPPEIGDFGLGGEDEISLDFENYLNEAGRDSHSTAKDSAEGTYSDDPGHASVYEGDKVPLHRSRDAGKTCKERFSYSSFDAGATVLKTGRSTKNAKAILIENKDSYMLLECGADSKYVIVELSDDILIDTVVLANFEFFSSMVRQFRVSVSDRYPVKMDRWKEIGTFEARNSRDIQAFLVDNPQIWAKYVRIEFQTHYGNEFYCPVSLLRIHGSRMLDSWKDMDGGREEEISIDEDLVDTTEELLDGTIHIPDVGVIDEAKEASESELDFTPWTNAPFTKAHSVCWEIRANEEDLLMTRKKSKPNLKEPSTTNQNNDGDRDISASSNFKTQSLPRGPIQTSSATTSVTAAQEMASQEMSSVKTSDSWTSSSALNTTSSATSSLPPTKASTSISLGQKPRGSGTMGAPIASPTVQEGFFNAITKRLHQAEANLTLTMQYLEDHSRFVQDSLQTAEQKQLSKVTTFLDNLNQTVLAELRGMRDQYDQIWQSTVIALETQKEQADRDIVALSSRLNLLADEVVFQKRMAIVQAVLLLCCLFLVIFSRGVPIPYLAPLLDQAGALPGVPSSHGDLSTRPLYTSQSREDDRENAQIDTWSPNARLLQAFPTTVHTSSPPMEGLEADHEPLLRSDKDSSGAYRLARLSPPLTPSFETSDPTATGLHNPDCDLDGPILRRPTAYHPHSNQSRKPLPALPEHPSPERPSSSS